ncbi:MAG: hypothetical protein NC314_13065 [Roseburia sp.]|nr:hypothetical protein [Roseburia sp.]MCM1243768.1 hypothetical protein [Roseburia sp.]
MPSTYKHIQLMETGIYLLLVCSMLFVSDIELAGFPVYTFFLLIAALYFMFIKIVSNRLEERSFKKNWYMTDILAAAAIVIALSDMIRKLFRDPDEGAIDFSIDAKVIAFALLYLVFMAGSQFKKIYFDLIAYCGLLVTGAYSYVCLTGEPVAVSAKITEADSGGIASYFMLFCMVGIYSYCTCKERLRSYFYLAVSLLGFLALLLNQNILSFWLMTIYFVAMPVMLRPTAQLVKKDMQLFFLYGFMMSNMSLITGYTDIIFKETAYSLEHSVYLDLLLAVGGILFFHYWERIPEGIDLERLVMRRMRKGYRLLLKIITVLLAGIMVSADKWTFLNDDMSGKVLKGFILPLVESVRESESGFYILFRETGMAGAVLALFFLILLFIRLWKNWGYDRPVTGILILISSVFMVQLLFWKPEIHTLTVYFMLLLFAAFNNEEKVRVKSIKIREETLREQAILYGAARQTMEK